jgi:CRISPR-associated protein Csc3
MRLLNRQPKTLEERYFSEIRPLLYERHGTHHQWGTRENHTLAEHLDSACQFVLTVSRMAQVPDDKRAVILAATAVHDLNKLDALERKVKVLARDKEFLKEQLEKAGVISFVPGEAELELARRLIERHSGHNASDGALFLPEDPQIKRWASILIAADLFDLNLPAHELTKKLQKELTVALNRPSHLYRVHLSEDRGYMTALLLDACEEILSEYKLTPLAIFPDGELFEGEDFPDVDLAPRIAARWQSKIDAVFGSNLDQLVKPTKDGIKVLPQAVQHDPQEILMIMMACLEKKKAGFKADKLQTDINKWGIEKVGRDAIEVSSAVGLLPVSTAEEFALAEGLKAAYLSYRQVKATSSKQAWDKIALHAGFAGSQRDALEPFDPQYGRPLFAARAVTTGFEGIQSALMESLALRKGSTSGESSELDENENEATQELIELVARTLNLPRLNRLTGFSELEAYTKANPKQRCSLGATVGEVQDVASMPIGTKVQVFSNRLPGGLIAEPRRQAEFTTLLAYQLLAIGAHFPAVKNEPPYYLNLALPSGSCPALLRIWRECLLGLAATNTEGGPASVDVLKLYKDNAVEFTSNKVVGVAFPSRPEFVHNSVQLPMVWGEANASVALLKSLRLALELSLSFEFGFPFVLSSSLQVEPSTEFYGRVEGIPTAFSRLLGSGRYSREEAEIVRDRLRWLGNLVQAVASIPKFDDCLYDLARATTKPFSLYYVLLRWILREQDKPNLELSWQKICVPLNRLLESLMPNETTELTKYLKESARLAAEFNLKGSSFKRTSVIEPFTAFLTSIRSVKPHMDLDFVFASLVQKYHTRLDRIRDHVVGETKFEQLKQYYDILRKLYEEVYHARPEKLLSDREDLEAAYLFFWQEAFQVVKARRESEAAAKKAKAEAAPESTQTTV